MLACRFTNEIVTSKTVSYLVREIFQEPPGDWKIETRKSVHDRRHKATLTVTRSRPSRWSIRRILLQLRRLSAGMCHLASRRFTERFKAEIEFLWWEKKSERQGYILRVRRRQKAGTNCRTFLAKTTPYPVSLFLTESTSTECPCTHATQPFCI